MNFLKQINDILLLIFLFLQHKEKFYFLYFFLLGDNFGTFCLFRTVFPYLKNWNIYLECRRSLQKMNIAEASDKLNYIEQ